MYVTLSNLPKMRTKIRSKTISLKPASRCKDLIVKKLACLVPLISRLALEWAERRENC
jgi:hypothetical protein